MSYNTKKSPYHNVRVTRGTYGELSKVQEELDEAIDAEIRGLDLLVLIELADVIGAVAGVAEEQYGFDLDQLIAFSEMVRDVKSKEAAQSKEHVAHAKQLLEAAKSERREFEGGWEKICSHIWDFPSGVMGAMIGKMQDYYLKYTEQLPLVLIRTDNYDFPTFKGKYRGKDEDPNWYFNTEKVGGFNSREIELLESVEGCEVFAEFLSELFIEQAAKFPKPAGLKGEIIGEDGESKGTLFSPKEYGNADE